MYIRNTAYEFLIKSRINKLDFGLELLQELAKSRGWALCPYSENEIVLKNLGLQDKTNLDAITYIHRENNQNNYIIFYNNTLSVSDRMFNILHEFGHILLNHNTESNIVGTSNMLEIALRQEKEANLFACEVLAPSCVFKELNITSIDDIKEISSIPIKHLSEHTFNITNFKHFDDLSKKVLTILDNYIKDYKKYTVNNDVEPVKVVVKKYNKKVVVTSILVLIVLVALFFFNSLNNNKVQQAFVNDADINSVDKTNEDKIIQSIAKVYTTKSGNKYHLPSCSYIKNKDDLVEHPYDTIDKVKYSPCSRCIKK